MRKATQCSTGAIDEAYCILGSVLRGQGQLTEAIVCFRSALHIDPEYERAKKALADVENVRRQKDSASE